MNSITTLLNNGYSFLIQAGGAALGIWGVITFFRALFSEGGRSPVRIVVALLTIAGGAAAFTLLPDVIDAGKQGGADLRGGGGGYSMPAPARIDVGYPALSTFPML